MARGWNPRSVELIRRHPEILADLLHGRSEAPDLRGHRFEPDERDYSQLPLIGADLVLLVRGPGRALLCALVIEIQLEKKREKERAWPAYQIATYRRLGCPTFVIVVAINDTVANWAAGPFDTGQTLFRPIVIRPSDLPFILDPGHARANVELAVLSGLLHGGEPEAEQIGVALWHALDAQPGEHHDLYWDLFLEAVDEATRRRLMIRFEGYQPQSEWGKKIYSDGERKGRLEGERVGQREGKAAALGVLLRARGLRPSKAQRQRIEQCDDLAVLDQWMRRAATATRLAEVFDP